MGFPEWRRSLKRAPQTAAVHSVELCLCPFHLPFPCFAVEGYLLVSFWNVPRLGLLEAVRCMLVSVHFCGSSRIR